MFTLECNDDLYLKTNKNIKVNEQAFNELLSDIKDICGVLPGLLAPTERQLLHPLACHRRWQDSASGGKCLIFYAH